ncbi:hypothetical protein HJC23_011065 [Cyclotella cryptica]|uniref:Uncharacterized protein n=1 Tax=Cyclotella cryptica TaxID=29204 RepID=A0ABD3PBP8_9STRA
MLYITEIDGNNWSRRFSRLLCTWLSLSPNVHYLPATLDNVTDVARYVVDEEHETEMEISSKQQIHGAREN